MKYLSVFFLCLFILNAYSQNEIKINTFDDIILTLNANTDSSIKQAENNYQIGYLYYDAILLSSNSDPGLRKKILAAYGIDDKNNPYIKGYSNKNKYNPPQGGGGTLLTTLGNTDVTYFAAGLSRFLAERTKEELNEAFFNQMKQQLNAYPELKTVFPQTASFLNVIETYSYASVIQVLKEAFETDIQNLPANFYNIKNLTQDDCDKIAVCGSPSKNDCNEFTNCQKRLKTLSDFFKTQNGYWLAFAMLTAKEGMQTTNPAAFLKLLTSTTEFSDLKTFTDTGNYYDDYNIVAAIQLNNLISQSLISKEENHIWINDNQMDSLLFKQKNAFTYYVGLLLALEQHKPDSEKIYFYTNNNEKIKLEDILIDAYNNHIDLALLIKNTYSGFNATNRAVKKIITATNNSVEAEPQALYDFYKAFTASLKPIVQSPILDSLVKRNIEASFYKVEHFINPAVDMAYHLATKKYSAAVFDASILLSTLDTFQIQPNHTPVFKPLTKSFLKYGMLISTVSSAQSSEEVKQALQASVLPVGSYSIKRKTDWSLSINAYVGAFWSYSNTAVSSNKYPSLGLTAPFGINISKGFSKKSCAGGLSLNLQLLDVGALVNYYLLKGDTASIPDDFNVRLSNIFSPGFSIGYNFPNIPLSLFWGGQYIPTIYTYQLINGINTLAPTNSWRWQLSLLVDIPLYNIYVCDFKK